MVLEKYRIKDGDCTTCIYKKANCPVNKVYKIDCIHWTKEPEYVNVSVIAAQSRQWDFSDITNRRITIEDGDV